MQFFIFGAGYSGRAIGRAAIAAGARAAGTTRSPEKAAALRGDGIEAFLFDGTSLSDPVGKSLRETTHLVISVAPDHGMREQPYGTASTADPVLAAARAAILSDMPSLRWIGYLSTVGVYGDHDGGWIDEEAECRPASRRSQTRLDAERAWQAVADEAGVPLAVLRLSGIYGPGRNGFVNLARGTARRIVKPAQVFNRIHVDDIAGAALFLASRDLGGVFNVTDDEPAPAQDVVAHAASLMAVEAPPEIAFDDAEMTPMARSFYGENKRVSNARLKHEGFRFLYPDYRTALADLWTDGRWRGD